MQTHQLAHTAAQMQGGSLLFVVFCVFFWMVVTQAQLVRRALVKVLLSLASVYAVLLSVTRESNDADVLVGYKS